MSDQDRAQEASQLRRLRLVENSPRLTLFPDFAVMHKHRKESLNQRSDRGLVFFLLEGKDRRVASRPVGGD